ncbi:MAG TPA: heterodisulfide reductase-related iron-sulfur binding cluster [Geothrix sp.]|uniref:heterodisulfide reductase-related iron-sulfur binding cluster n=1 Tax=Geothrix mesophila TaxID=2922723 RepID=UPI001FAD106C|nr:heterodisulfide reductase-related iron-sulfur binding cluster [Geothrix sp. SG198]HJV37221.1 heterodisulfide reductase-related iron-sulfur binding cluster [Geothrix sp.]
MAERYEVDDHVRPHTTPGERISYVAGKGTTYDATDPRYWDEALLKEEVERAFEICHGCRMCFKYCDAFPGLFALLDQKHHGDVRALSKEERDGIMDDCFQCKLCEVQCPYTPREGHAFALDFPRLVHRYQAQRRKREGGTLRDKLLGDPDLSAKLARTSFGLANTMNRVAIHRWFMEKTLGIHRDAHLPDFASATFEAWAEKSGRIQAKPGAEAVLFQTCIVQNNEPQLGKDTLEVLEKNGCRAGCVKGLQCCGMPAWEHGDLESLRKQAHANLDALMPHVEAGSLVLAINPTCAMMLRQEYPELLEGEDRERAKKLAAAVRDPAEFLWSIRNEPRANWSFESSPGPIAYHAPCHLRAQRVGFKGRDLLKRIPGVSIVSVMECCGHDGTYAMRAETYEASRRVGQKAFAGMQAAEEATVWATECPLAGMQFEQHAGRRALHPMTILARAYRKDGFPSPLAPETP